MIAAIEFNFIGPSVAVIFDENMKLLKAFEIKRGLAFWVDFFSQELSSLDRLYVFPDLEFLAFSELHDRLIEKGIHVMRNYEPEIRTTKREVDGLFIEQHERIIKNKLPCTRKLLDEIRSVDISDLKKQISDLTGSVYDYEAYDDVLYFLRWMEIKTIEDQNTKDHAYI